MKEDLRAYLNYLKTQINKSAVEVLLNTEVDKNFIENINPDSVVVAIGAEPITLPILGIDSKNVYQAEAFIKEGIEKSGNKVTILGAGSVGCELALELSALGKKVTIIEKGDKIARNGNELYRTDLLIHLQKGQNIEVLLNSECVQINDNNCVVNCNGTMKEINHSDFILSLGYRTDTQKVFDLFGVVPQTMYVGDCKNVASITEATTEGYFIGASL